MSCRYRISTFSFCILFIYSIALCTMHYRAVTLSFFVLIVISENTKNLFYSFVKKNDIDNITDWKHFIYQWCRSALTYGWLGGCSISIWEYHEDLHKIRSFWIFQLLIDSSISAKPFITLFVYSFIQLNPTARAVLCIETVCWYWCRQFTVVLTIVLFLLFSVSRLTITRKCW
jgi:hypothetical protein